MAYTPTNAFSVAGTPYTPSTHFSFGVTVDFKLGQSWALSAPTVADTGLDQAWSLSAAAVADAVLDQSWILSVPAFSDRPMDQDWSVLIPSFTDHPHHQSWGLAVPAFMDRPFHQSWALLNFTYVDAPVLQQWALQATAVWTPVVTAIHYTLTLTGAADSTSDAVLPMSSFQSRLRSGDPSYLQAVVPYTVDLATAIADRPNGQLVIHRGLRWTDGTTQTAEIARANLEMVQTAVGARSASITLSGHRTSTNATPKSVALSQSTYRAVSSGKRRYRCAINNDLLPGDTALIDGDSFVIGELQHIVDTSSAIMEIAEING